METLKHEPRLDPPEPKVAAQCAKCGEFIYEYEDACPVPGWGWLCDSCARERRELTRDNASDI